MLGDLKCVVETKIGKGVEFLQTWMFLLPIIKWSERSLMKYIESEANKKINQVDILSKNISRNSWSRSYKEISVARMRKRGDRNVRTQDQRWECGTLCNHKGPASVVTTKGFCVKSLVRFWV